MKYCRILFVLITLSTLPCMSNATSPRETTAVQEQYKITVLDGKVTLQMREGSQYPCIGVRLMDGTIGMQMATVFEMKRDKKRYVVEIDYGRKKFRTMDKAIEAYLEELFTHFYGSRDPEYGQKAWAAFVTEGGLRSFINVAKLWIDDKFLDTPWNEIYG